MPRYATVSAGEAATQAQPRRAIPAESFAVAVMALANMVEAQLARGHVAGARHVEPGEVRG